eukprot:108703-Amphidinium_carterae.1
MKIYDANFWRDVIRNGFDKYLQRIHDGPHLCYASITFTYDGEMDTSESASKSSGEHVEYVSDVLLGRCELATAACRKIETLMETEIILFFVKILE